MVWLILGGPLTIITFENFYKIEVFMFNWIVGEMEINILDFDKQIEEIWD